MKHWQRKSNINLMFITEFILVLLFRLSLNQSFKVSMIRRTSVHERNSVQTFIDTVTVSVIYVTVKHK